MQARRDARGLVQEVAEAPRLQGPGQGAKKRLALASKAATRGRVTEGGMPRRVSPTPAAVSSFNLSVGSSSCSLRQRGKVRRGVDGAFGCLTGESYDGQHTGCEWPVW